MKLDPSFTLDEVVLSIGSELAAGGFVEVVETARVCKKPHRILIDFAYGETLCRIPLPRIPYVSFLRIFLCLSLCGLLNLIVLSRSRSFGKPRPEPPQEYPGSNGQHALPTRNRHCSPLPFHYRPAATVLVGFGPRTVVATDLAQEIEDIFPHPTSPHLGWCTAQHLAACRGNNDSVRALALKDSMAPMWMPPLATSVSVVISTWGSSSSAVRTMQPSQRRCTLHWPTDMA